MFEISTSNNNFYKAQFDEAIELKQLKENMINKYHEEINLFANEFAEMIMNPPPVDKNTNTCISVKFEISGIPLESFTDSELSARENLTMVVEFKKIMLLGSDYFEDCPFHKLFVKHFHAIKDIMYNRIISEITHDVLNQLETLQGFKDLKWGIFDDNSIKLQIPIKNPNYSAPAAN